MTRDELSTKTFSASVRHKKLLRANSLVLDSFSIFLWNSSVRTAPELIFSLVKASQDFAFFTAPIKTDM
jgi:archaellum biogenesis ATPase FlaH